MCTKEWTKNTHTRKLKLTHTHWQRDVLILISCCGNCYTTEKHD